MVLRSALHEAARDLDNRALWFAVCFQSRAEKVAFLRKHNLEQLGDKYLPGSEVDNILRRPK
ncbi:hypothetical protein [Agreia sp. Leaf283]|uniref:hypothetical protein n=1 Tax=Agreia sp. Leaf283 TaxID=1736321 RepID=UPI0006F7C813|nr:hypothetical protein [Agreia sp. Leaf283]KQP57795.1 hypothetical protein ASF51_08380 [Agreia sp. Leaf283]